MEDFTSFIEENRVYGFFKDPITLASGRKSHFYANWRDVVEDVFLADKLADFVLAFAKEKKIPVDTFYGVPEGATKLGIITQYKHAKMQEGFGKGSHALAMGRAKQKDHGAPKDKFFVGMPRGDTIVLEDVTTTGGSLISHLKMLKESGVKVTAVISLTNRMEKRDDGLSVEQAVSKEGFRFFTMSKATDVLPLAYARLSPGKDIGKAVEDEFTEYGVQKLSLVR